MTRVAGILRNRFRGFPQLAAPAWHFCNRGTEAVSFAGKRFLAPAKTAVLLTSRCKTSIVPRPPQGGIFDFFGPASSNGSDRSLKL
ncbi:hypothetical protein DQ393_21545 [Rhizobium tropici]|uniref:Uncharacterized protein n=1 Tax=Rhizobium tropici TaxID=398 RepID=A0A329Y9H3_RHITR|nr:hypothetical protein DQ393_21545 [Rhizobium tropici]